MMLGIKIGLGIFALWAGAAAESYYQTRQLVLSAVLVLAGTALGWLMIFLISHAH